MKAFLDTLNTAHGALSNLLSTQSSTPSQSSSAERYDAATFAPRLLAEETDTAAVRATEAAIRLLREGRLDAALCEFHSVTRCLPQNARAKANLGCAYYAINDFSSAQYWLSEAHFLEPCDTTIALASAAVEEQKGRPEEARRVLVKALAENPDQVSVLKQLGQLHQRQGQWSQAAGCFHKLLSVDPTNGDWPLYLQTCLDQVPTKGDNGVAVPHPSGANGAFARAFSFAEPILQQAKSQDHGLHRTEPALHRAKKAELGLHNTAPMLPSGSSLLSNTEPSLQAQSAQHNTTEGALRLAELEERQGRLQEALTCLQKAATSRQISPEDLAPRIARLHLILGDTSAAKTALYLSTRSQIPSILEEAAKLQGIGQYASAMVLLEAALCMDQTDPKVIQAAADCKRSLLAGDHVTSPSRNRQSFGHTTPQGAPLPAQPVPPKAPSDPPDWSAPAVDLHEPRVKGLCDEAQKALAEENLIEALTSATEAYQLAPTDLRARNLLAMAHIRVADYPKALSVLSRVVESPAPGRTGQSSAAQADAHSLAAEAHERLRQFPEAFAQAKAALALDPHHVAARLNLATALQQSGSDTEAEAELNKILAREPHQPVALLRLGYTRLSKGDNSGALQIFDRAAGCAAALARSSSCSVEGAARAYSAIAMHLLAFRGDDVDSRRLQHMLNEALRLHRNLAQVWHELEHTQALQPRAAVQRLRGICDLDLTGHQAKDLLLLLAQRANCTELARALQAGVTPVRQRPSMGTVEEASPMPGGAGHRNVSPMPGRHRDVSPMPGSVQGPASARSRDVSPMASSRHSSQQWGDVLNQSGCSSGYNTPKAPMDVPIQVQRERRSSRGLAAPAGLNVPPQQQQQPPPQVQAQGGVPVRGRTSAPYAPQQAPRLRDPSPCPARHSGTRLELGLHEVVKPEELIFGPCLGSGGSGQVFRGTFRGREVAIKKVSDMTHLDELFKEVEALRKLRHPRLVQFFGACIQPGCLMIVQELIPNGSLYDWLWGPRRVTPLSAAQCLTIAIQSAEALSFLHSLRVVHRDVKSMNILIDAQLGAKVCDFGLAQQMNAGNKTHMNRKLEGEGGSPRYMAPECFDTGGKLTEKIDVWAMGCVLIELFGKILPYQDCNAVPQLIKRILVDRRPPDIPATVPPAQRAIINGCIQYSSAQRTPMPAVHASLSKLMGTGVQL